MSDITFPDIVAELVAEHAAAQEAVLRIRDEVGTFMGVAPSAVTRLHRGFPLQLSQQRSLSYGSFRVIGEHGEAGEIGLDSTSIPFSNDVQDRMTVPEEVVHYFHCAINTSIRARSMELGKLRTEELPPRYLASVAEEALEETPRETDRFISQSGLSFDTNSVESKARAFDFTISRLSLRQLVVLDRTLTDMGVQAGSYPVHTARYESIEDYVRTLLEQGQDEFSYSIMRLREEQKSITKLELSNVKSRLTELEPAEMERILTTAGLAVDPLWKCEQVKMLLAGLPDQDARLMVRRLLSHVPTKEEMVTVAQEIMPDDGNQYARRIWNAKGDLELQRFREELVGAVRDMVSFTNVGRTILTRLFALRMGVSEVSAVIKSRVLAFVEDLPDDIKARNALLSNPEYIAMRDKAAEALLADPIASPFSGLGFNIKEFSASSHAASRVVTAAMSRPSTDLEAPAFLASARSTANYYRKQGGYLGWSTVIAEATDAELITRGYKLSDKIGPAEYEDAKRSALAKSREKVRESVRIQELKHDIDILMEPIAKVISAQFVDQTFEEVKFESSMLGSYSDLIGAPHVQAWIRSIWNFVTHARKSGRCGEIMRSFLEAKTLEEQHRVLKDHGIPVVAYTAY